MGKILLSTIALALSLAASQYAAEPVLKMEVLMNNRMLDEVGLAGDFVDDFDITPDKMVLLLVNHQMHLVGWGGIVPAGKEIPGTVSSFAYSADGMFMMVRDNELVTFNSDKQLEKIFTLPDPGMRICFGCDCLYIYNCGNAQSYSLYAYFPGRKSTKVLDSPESIEALTMMGQEVYMAAGRIIYSFAPGEKFHPLIAVPEKYGKIHSLAADASRHILYFSTGESVYCLRGENIIPISKEYGGLLKFKDGRLFIFQAKKKLLICITGLNRFLDQAFSVALPTDAAAKEENYDKAFVQLKEGDLTKAAMAKALQVLIEKGRQAAQKQKWSEALKYYGQAQKRAFLSPQIMYNLALAQAQLGNELLADAWFRAYLGAVPDAANAEQTNKEIISLEKKAEAKMMHLFWQAEQLAAKLPIQGETAYAQGRRTAAFISIGHFRATAGDLTGAEEDRLMAEQAAGKETPYGNYLKGMDGKYELYAQSLIDSGAIEGAQSILEKIQDEGKKNRLKTNLLTAMIKAGDSQQAKKLLANQYIPVNSNLTYIILAFAEKGDFTTVDSLIKQGPADPWIYTYLARWQLARGNISAALQYARSSEQRAEVLSITGQCAAAFARLMNNEDTSIFQPRYILEVFNYITQDLIFLGDMPNAQRAADLAEEWAANNTKYFPNRRYAKGYAGLAGAYLDVENGRVDDAIKRIEKVADLEAKELALESGREVYTEARDLELRREICDFAISRGKWEAAEKVADSFSQNRVTISFLQKILEAYKSKNNLSEAERLGQKLESLKAESRLGWGEKNPGREIIVKAWLDIVEVLNKEVVMGNLSVYLDSFKNDPPENLPWRFAYAAARIGLGLAKIRAMDKFYH